ncbi:hypothetical protein, partial [Gilliamella sp. Pas-s27]|uniref:hypothetical protein n=1 Tax=Gilliamella sp. Pas-s27 TaxID=2687311 RepID=UPI00136658AC
KLSLRDNRAIDAQNNVWLKIDVLDDKNRPNKGWVLVNGEGAKRVCCWDWFDFTQIKETLSILDKQYLVEANAYASIKEACFQ